MKTYALYRREKGGLWHYYRGGIALGDAEQELSMCREEWRIACPTPMEFHIRREKARRPDIREPFTPSGGYVWYERFLRRYGDRLTDTQRQAAGTWCNQHSTWNYLPSPFSLADCQTWQHRNLYQDWCNSHPEEDPRFQEMVHRIIAANPRRATTPMYGRSPLVSLLGSTLLHLAFPPELVTIHPPEVQSVIDRLREEIP